jgi:hypothetical protein
MARKNVSLDAGENDDGKKGLRKAADGPTSRVRRLPITLVDDKARLWTTDIGLPGNTDFETLLEIAELAIGVMMGSDAVQFSDLTLFIEPHPDGTLDEVDEKGRILIMHKEALRRLEGKK